MAMDIRFNEVNFAYQANTPFETRALFDVNFNIPAGKYTAIIGHTGSGKSTILQHLNALLKPTSGTVTLGDRVVDAETSNKDLKPLRQKVGIVFQFPESQLFEETVEKDIAFGPKNFGASEEEANQLAKETLKIVGLPEEVLHKSPFDLSGGQMRRVAIAGVLAMQPEVLVLDEPTAGLDVEGRLSLHEQIRKLKSQGKTIVLASHDMAEVETLCDRIAILNNGKIVFCGTPSELTDRLGRKYFIHLKTRDGEESFETDTIEDTLISLLEECKQKHIQVLDIKVDRGTLEQHFIEMARRGSE